MNWPSAARDGPLPPAAKENSQKSELRWGTPQPIRNLSTARYWERLIGQPQPLVIVVDIFQEFH